MCAFNWICRNEKRRIEGTGEAPAWQYYHEVDELLGSHNDHSLDLSNLDESNNMNSSSISMYIYGICEQPPFLCQSHQAPERSVLLIFSIYLSEICKKNVSIFPKILEDEVVSIGDSCSDNDTDENRHSSGESQHAKNGYDHSPKKLKMVKIFRSEYLIFHDR